MSWWNSRTSKSPAELARPAITDPPQAKEEDQYELETIHYLEDAPPEVVRRKQERRVYCESRPGNPAVIKSALVSGTGLLVTCPHCIAADSRDNTLGGMTCRSSSAYRDAARAGMVEAAARRTTGANAYAILSRIFGGNGGSGGSDGACINVSDSIIIDMRIDKEQATIKVRSGYPAEMLFFELSGESTFDDCFRLARVAAARLRAHFAEYTAQVSADPKMAKARAEKNPWLRPDPEFDNPEAI